MINLFGITVDEKIYAGNELSDVVQYILKTYGLSIPEPRLCLYLNEPGNTGISSKLLSLARKAGFMIEERRSPDPNNVLEALKCQYTAGKKRWKSIPTVTVCKAVSVETGKAYEVPAVITDMDIENKRLEICFFGNRTEISYSEYSSMQLKEYYFAAINPSMTMIATHRTPEPSLTGEIAMLDSIICHGLNAPCLPEDNDEYEYFKFINSRKHAVEAFESVRELFPENLPEYDRYVKACREVEQKYAEKGMERISFIHEKEQAFFARWKHIVGMKKNDNKLCT